MRIVVRVVPRALCVAYYLTMGLDRTSWALAEETDHALIFPGPSHAQSAIDGFLCQQRNRSDWYADIQDADDPERAPLEPIWTGAV